MAVYKFAGFWRRLVAYTIDTVIINIIFTVLFLIASVALFTGVISGDSAKWLTDLMNPTKISGAILVVSALYLALTIAYFTYFHGMNGRTPGKMILGLQVLSTDGKQISFGIAFLRSVGYLISGLVLNIGFIWAAFDRRKQGWHDKIAGTIVIIRPGETQAAGIDIQESPSALAETRFGNQQNDSDRPAAVQTVAEKEGKEITVPPGTNT